MEGLAVAAPARYPEIAQYFLENVNLAKEYLKEILGIEVDEDEEMDVGN
jgi:hypothetical protein